jgi:hypothetical protein
VNNQEDGHSRSDGENYPQDGELSVHPVPSLLWGVRPHPGDVFYPPKRYQADVIRAIGLSAAGDTSFGSSGGPHRSPIPWPRRTGRPLMRAASADGSEHSSMQPRLPLDRSDPIGSARQPRIESTVGYCSVLDIPPRPGPYPRKASWPCGAATHASPVGVREPRRVGAPQRKARGVRDSLRDPRSTLRGWTEASAGRQVTSAGWRLGRRPAARFRSRKSRIGTRSRCRSPKPPEGSFLRTRRRRTCR